MIRAVSLVATAIAAYLLILVFTFPAVQLEQRIENRLQGLSLTAVSGSVFYGAAGRVNYQGIDLGSVRWSFSPLALLTGRLEYHAGFSTPAGPGQADVGVTFSGHVYGHDIDLSLLPGPVIDRYSPVVVESSGTLKLVVEAFKMNDGFPADVSGQVTWKSAAILSPVEMVFGDTVLELQNVGEELVGRVTNAADFELSGEIAITPEGTYRVDLLLLPGADASRNTLALLDSTTTAQPGGEYLLRSTGRL